MRKARKAPTASPNTIPSGSEFTLRAKKPMRGDQALDGRAYDDAPDLWRNFGSGNEGSEPVEDSQEPSQNHSQ